MDLNRGAVKRTLVTGRLNLASIAQFPMVVLAWILISIERSDWDSTAQHKHHFLKVPYIQYKTFIFQIKPHQ
jgi:hypothetical protein